MLRSDHVKTLSRSHSCDHYSRNATEHEAVFTPYLETNFFFGIIRCKTSPRQTELKLSNGAE